MGLARVKSRKQRIRLEDRVKSWERTIAGLPTTVNKDGWKKPGSNKK